MRLVEFKHNDTIFYVNPQHVVALFKKSRGDEVSICTVSQNADAYTTETLSEVAAKLTAQGEPTPSAPSRAEAALKEIYDITVGLKTPFQDEILYKIYKIAKEASDG